MPSPSRPPHHTHHSTSSQTAILDIDDSDVLDSQSVKGGIMSSGSLRDSADALRAIQGADGEEEVKEKRPWYHPLVVLDFLIGNWFLIGIGVSIVLAWRFPHVAASGGCKYHLSSLLPLLTRSTDIRSEYSIHYGAISLIFLITGLTLSTSALFHHLANWRLHLFTQIFCFLFFSAIVFAIVNCVRASGNESIDKYVLAGMVIMSVMPTTVASNITMTRSAGGSTEAATMEVCVGNLLGTFITPLLCEMFFSSSAWSYGQPIAKGGYEGSAGLKEIYRHLAKQLGLTLFIPLLVGQIILHFFPRQVKWLATTFRLPKVSTFLLLLLIWTTFSTQFKEGAFQSISTASIIFLVFVNLALYFLFTGICVFCTRLPFLPESFNLGIKPHPALEEAGEGEGEGGERVYDETKKPYWRRFVSGMRFDKQEATAICFCAAAKGMVVGAPTLTILYGGQQVAVAQILVYFFKKWNEKPDRLAGIRNKAEKTPLVEASGGGRERRGDGAAGGEVRGRGSSEGLAMETPPAGYGSV
ncbi:hypothetical protein B9479_007980 [Cryptococcus floricola]|uniref:Uncharacterized protein n=1 Tax=Cryptococcus floricola TaxID=2591691 RepID=A0A5D3AIT3_9TREE|nr:hypothetical protein B9479_007980 [Cryptococcus floricola]